MDEGEEEEPSANRGQGMVLAFTGVCMWHGWEAKGDNMGKYHIFTHIPPTNPHKPTTALFLFHGCCIEGPLAAIEGVLRCPFYLLGSILLLLLSPCAGYPAAARARAG